MSLDDEEVAQSLEELENLPEDLFLDDVDEKPKSKWQPIGVRLKGRRLKGRGRNRGKDLLDSWSEDPFVGNKDSHWTTEKKRNPSEGFSESYRNIYDDEMEFPNRSGNTYSRTVRMNYSKAGKTFTDNQSRFADTFELEGEPPSRSDSSPGFPRSYERSRNRENRSGGSLSGDRRELGRHIDCDLERDDFHISGRKEVLRREEEVKFMRNISELRSRQPEIPGLENDDMYGRKSPAYDLPRKDNQTLSQNKHESPRNFDSRFSSLATNSRPEFDNRFGDDGRLDRSPVRRDDLFYEKSNNKLSDVMFGDERRKPRSITPNNKEEKRSLSPAVKHEHSPGHKKRERDYSPRNKWERSISPRHTRNSSSPKRRDRRERSGTPQARRESPSPKRRERQEQSSSGRHARESISPKRRERRDRSLSPRNRRYRDSPSPPRRRRRKSSDSHGSSMSSVSPVRNKDPLWQRSPLPSTGPPGSYANVRPQASQTYDMLQQPVQSSFPESNYSSSLPSAANTYTNQPQPYAQNYQQYGSYESYYQQIAQAPSYSGDFQSNQSSTWQDSSIAYPDMSQPPPQIPTGTPTSTSVDQQKLEEAKKEAIQNELLQQKQTLSKQREEYVKKATVITRELSLLKNQEEELLGENSPDNKRILKENHKLQQEIQNKLKAINNVIDMLTGIIGDERPSIKDSRLKDKEKSKKSAGVTLDSPTDPLFPKSISPLIKKAEESTSMKALDSTKPVYNYIYYDPEMHWCRVCDVFPRTAKEFLNHLHSSDHKQKTQERKLVDMPWHKLEAEQEVPHHEGAPTKRTPIRGLQFFISSTAWFCKLCSTWIGDLHCASLHLKSKAHSENYSKFTEQNPHWETDWLADREKAYERQADKRLRIKEDPHDLLNLKCQPTDDKSLRNNLDDIILNQDSKIAPKGDDLKKKKKKRKSVTKLGQTKESSTSSSSSSSSSTSSSSSSSGSEADDEEKARSIRVAMRNKAKILAEKKQNPDINKTLEMPKAPRSKWDSPEPETIKKQEASVKDKLQIQIKEEFSDDKMLKAWMTPSKITVPDGEKQLFSSLKDRLKQKEAERESGKKRDDYRTRDRDREREKDRYYSDRNYNTDKKSKRRTPSPPSPPSRGFKSEKFTDYRWERKFDKIDNEKERSHMKDTRDNYRKSPKRESSKASSSKYDTKRKNDSGRGTPERTKKEEKKQLAKDDDDGVEEDENSAESKFEKQTAESAAIRKGKKPPILTMPKSKLPFIGRMPILKNLAKKKGPGGNEIESKQTDKVSDEVLAQLDAISEKPVSERDISPQIGDTSKTLSANDSSKNILDNSTSLPDNSIEQVPQDMDIDEDNSNGDTLPLITIPVPPEPQPVLSEKNDDLPKDFQDALDILFPSEESRRLREESLKKIEEGQMNPEEMMQHHNWMHGPLGVPMQGQMMPGYGTQMMSVNGHPAHMMAPPPGMHVPPPPIPGHPMQSMYQQPPPNMVDHQIAVQPSPQNSFPLHVSMNSPLPLPTSVDPKSHAPDKSPSREPPKPARREAGRMSKEDLAMLGIDAEDMAAQSFN